VNCYHCDHQTGGASVQDGNRFGSGTEYWICCRCGREYEKIWKMGPNPAHGPHAPYIRVYISKEKSDGV
jgi:hypothetical protein